MMEKHEQATEPVVRRELAIRHVPGEQQLPIGDAAPRREPRELRQPGRVKSLQVGIELTALAESWRREQATGRSDYCALDVLAPVV